MEPGLPCDCAVNTAVLSRREPAQHRETLSSLLLLIEKPIAIYLLTLDIESVPRGAAPAEPPVGSRSHLRPPSPPAAGVGMLVLPHVTRRRRRRRRVRASPFPAGLPGGDPSLWRAGLMWD